MWATFVFLYVVSVILKSNNDLDGRANPWASHALAIDQRPVSMSAGAISNGLSIDFALLSPVPLHSFAGLPSAGSPDINLPGNKFCDEGGNVIVVLYFVCIKVIRVRFSISPSPF